MKQVYEDYWQITLSHSDIYGVGFNIALREIIQYIDAHISDIPISPTRHYKALQGVLEGVLGITDTSVRKCINQFIKLGFVNTGLKGYVPDAKAFILTSDPELKKILFSRVVYSRASFSRSFEKDSDLHQIGFLIKTLEKHGGVLSRDDVVALMTIDIALAGTNYADADMLIAAKKLAKLSGFTARKYNQASHLWLILKQLDSLAVQDNKLYFKDDPRLLDSVVKQQTTGRDPYLQRLYKKQLITESIEHFSDIVCMVEELDYPVLIASHIKPYSRSSIQEEFDANNGLLLSRSIDQMFDGGYISFTDDGKIIISRTRNLSLKLIDHLSSYKINSSLMNGERCRYMEYHREHVFIA